MEVSSPSAKKNDNLKQLIISLSGTVIAIITLTLPFYFITRLSDNQIDNSLQPSKLMTTRK